MADFVHQELSGVSEWRTVLEAYERQTAERRRETPNDDGWLPRHASLAGIDSTRLRQIHGKLIALGLLQFEVAGNSGMHYQVSTLGRRTLERDNFAEVDSDHSAGQFQLPADD